jgi:hypothetical protein
MWGYATRPLDEEWDVLLLASHWWVEASAVWSETHFGRGRPDSQYALEIAHSRFVRRFQRTDESLHAPFRADEDYYFHKYAAYIWFFFMEQEIGAEAVGRIFRELQSVEPGDDEAAMAVIDAELPLAEHFRDFAVRNLNLNLLPGDPITPSYDDFDPAFPDNYPPPMTVGEMRSDARLRPQEEGEEPRRVADRIKSLSAHYYRFTPDPEAEIGQIGFDFSGLAPAEALAVDAIVKIRNKGWERRRLDPNGAITFCTSRPEDDVQDMFLVLSNHDRNLATSVQGEVTVSVLAEPCED